MRGLLDNLIYENKSFIIKYNIHRNCAVTLVKIKLEHTNMYVFSQACLKLKIRYNKKVRFLDLMSIKLSTDNTKIENPVFHLAFFS